MNVAGLVCASDILKTVKDATKYDKILIPDCMLRHEGDCFLDDMTPENLAEALGVTVEVVETDGAALLAALMK